MTKQDAVKELLHRHPKAPTRTLARILTKKYPKLFTGLEMARKSIAYRRGQSGVKNRKHLSDKSFKRCKGSQSDRPDESMAAEASAPEPLSNTVLRVLSKNLRQKKPVGILELSNKLDRSPASVQAAISELQVKGYNIATNPENDLELSANIPKQESVKIDTEDYFGDDWVRFGVIADTHLVSKYAREDVLNALYDVYAREGLRTVYHCGNWIDGEAPFNKYDLHCIGVENQIQYFLDHYPARKGITTQIVSGDDHEGWYVQRDQINVGKVMQDRAEDAGRHDLKDLGYMERDIEFKRGNGKSVIRVIHAGGGSAYAISYTSQKYVESLQGGEKPSMILVGHYHKYDWSYPREVNVIQAGCTQDQTPFMRKKRLQAMVGGCIVEAKQDRRGVFVRVRVEWLPFFDKKFYSFKWN
jgi:biotin operon repressor